MEKSVTIRKNIKNLYQQYEFQFEAETDAYILFLYAKGYFNNAEIVFCEKTKDIETLKKEYENAGYSVKLREFTSVEEIHDELFNGFFRSDLHQRRLRSLYEQFERKQNMAFLDGNTYSYIPCNYVLNSKECDEGLISFLMNKVKDDRSSLTFLEAAAGFGKTCSTFELMNSLVKEGFKSYLPLFIELSKNRSAKIFRYVLLDEIKDTFPGIPYSLVIEEIKNGKIPLIIDGFDELLSNSSDENEENKSIAEQSQTMISTILDLFTTNSKTKIIITSRRTSFRTGSILDLVLEKLTGTNELNQLTIREPNILNWLGADKREKLKIAKIPIEKLKNPIMLSYLKGMDISDFDESEFNYEKLVNDYITKLLQREMERQSLNFVPDEQKNIFIYLASYFLSFHITAEDPNSVYTLLKDILNDHFDIREKIALYTNDEERPSEKELISKLSHHALLDTNAAQKNYVGFINDFILGLFMGYSIIWDKTQEDKIAITDSELEKICSAFQGMNKDTKNMLFAKLNKMILNQTEEMYLHIDSTLNGAVSRDYDGLMVEAEEFRNFNFSDYTVSNSVFTNCSFFDCQNLHGISKSQFYNCKFYPKDCSVFEEENENYFVGCEGNTFKEKDISECNDSQNYIKKVLEQYWPKGKEYAGLRRWPKTLYRGFDQKEFEFIDVAISKLTRDGILIWTGICYQLNLEKISDIREILGR